MATSPMSPGYDSESSSGSHLGGTANRQIQVFGTLPRRHKQLALTKSNPLATSPMSPSYDSERSSGSHLGGTDNRQIQVLATLPRRHKQLALTKSNPLADTSDCQKTMIVINKQDNETFGFEIQTLGVNQRNVNTVERYTCVCKVHENSPSCCAGLKPGDILININGTSTEGCSHREIVNLIKSAGNILSLLTMNKNSVKKSELETRLYFLKKTLQEKWVEYKSLLLQEQRLVHGFLRNNNLTESSNSFLFDDTVLFGSTAQKKERFSSDSSCRSQLSFMTDDSEDRVFQPGMHDDLVTGNHRRRSSMDEDCVFHREAEMFAPKSQLSRSRSISMTSSSGSSSVASPSWDVNGGYGTISRKSRRPSVRKRLMKFIPGLNRADEEDESHL
ncbi:cytohesin-interacting protein isoform X2 [Leucoraja erinacea]|uniref:cytohesin-interacting protein isoform X2 n=1 Tax=Leucoraja erinaceus TaxID=7782 RepID=UPI002456D871|nr:cytohesin-interacting protein isoform X2 [Leucoraja erinacea]